LTAAPPPPPPFARELRSVGVTGTNGKTSTTTLVAALLSKLARPVVATTTLGSYLDGEPLDVPKTYAGFIETMRRCHARGGRFAAVELTSEALARGFAHAWPCEVGVFTNLTRDHLDAHGSAEHYLASKAQLFMHLPSGGTAVLNGCDPASELLAEVIPAGVRVLRYGVSSRGKSERPLDLEATRVELSWEGTRVELAESTTLPDAPRSFRIQAIGDVYAENALAALSAALSLGVSGNDAADALAAARFPAGRFQVVARAPFVVVDFAHTPDALERTLRAAKTLCAGALTVVFGAGGNRDREKRAPMGAAARIADRVVLTSDNPRGEDPAVIAESLRAGLGDHGDVRIELDRARAIELALAHALQSDVVVIAGKGHETDQTIGTEVRAFSDVEVAKRALETR
jgi:UDP-N-acetylmuramoyl-L-alanyl-D-glutamate--2,6-diaminopimelate ligase